MVSCDIRAGGLQASGRHRDIGRQCRYHISRRCYPLPEASEYSRSSRFVVADPKRTYLSSRDCLLEQV